MRPGSGKKANWVCKQFTSLVHAQKRGCPACANKVLHSDGRNSLAVLRPDLAEELFDDTFNEFS